MVFINTIRRRAGRLPSVATVATVLLVWLLGGTTTRAFAAAPTEYELKAVFLLNFARFTAWPQSALAPDDAALVVGVLGTDPFGSVLEVAFQDELIAGHRLEIRRFSRQDEFSNCHLLFISRSEAPNLPQVISALKGRHVLTVSDIDHFVYKDGMIGMLMDQNRVKVQVNYDQTRREGLELSAKLLKVSFVLRKDLRSMIRTVVKVLCRRERRAKNPQTRLHENLPVDSALHAHKLAS